ncbi:MAG: asparagine synthase (glutamine-hydrolyzing) [Candidatus Andersenbacteria bacterium]|nr:asparagine synthase (glutamine-hydrolyzing) [Candidatus Andersenbacteria bacterium]
MCGIAGKVSFGADVTYAELKAMGNAIAHRGPDDEGQYVAPNQKIGLAHRRLAIVDLSRQGHQPMRYKERYVISFNGEIYNFQEEKSALKKKGYAFSSHTDTEVILALYHEYGPACLHHLRGMFAFAIYDEHKNTLFCANDRLGKKPFKYVHNHAAFLFASELKAIVTQRQYRPEPDPLAIHHYLTYQYVPAPLTGFRDIKKLPPATYMVVNCTTGKIESTKYWELQYLPDESVTENEWAERIVNGLAQATQQRLVADVPIGAFLSGGIDSSAIVALMSKEGSQAVKTFSIGWREATHNELGWAKKIAALFQTEHTEFIVEPKAVGMLPELVAAYEEPYADTSALPTYYLSKLTREHVTVALTGDGGDENFAGYSRYSLHKLNLWLDAWAPWLNPVFAQTGALAGSLPHPFFDTLARLTSNMSQPYDKRYAQYISFFSNQDKKDLYTDAFAAQVLSHNSIEILEQAFARYKNQDKAAAAVAADIATYLPGALLPKVDIASMQVALEARSPFLDHAFMEMAAHIPINLKIRGLTNRKYILKKALRNILPQEILHRRKQGFGVPLNRWFKEDLQTYLSSILLSRQAQSRNLFKPEAIKKLIYLNGHGRDRSSQLWALLTLELWHRAYFD